MSKPKVATHGPWILWGDHGVARIDAVPELLEALRATVGALEEALTSDIRPRSATRPMATEALDLATAAIAKAEGREGSGR